MTEPVLVIGAGYAGLTAAVALSERGVPVQVFEKRRFPGGRASSLLDPVTHDLVDVGSHVFFGCYDATRRFLRTIGTENELAFQADPGVPIHDRETGRTIALRMPAFPAPLHLLFGLSRFRLLSAKDKLSTFGLLPSLLIGKNQFPERLDRISAEEWLKSHHQSAAVIRYVWEPFCRAAVNLPLDRASAALLKVSMDRALFAGRDAARVGVPKGPFVSLLSPQVEDSLSARGGSVRYQTRVSGITVNAGGITGVRTHNGEEIAGRTVLCAVPHHQVPNLLGDLSPELEELTGALHTLSGSSIITVYLWLDRPVLETPFLALIGCTYEWAFADARTDAVPQSETGGRHRVSLLLSAGDQYMKKRPEDLIDLARRDLEAVFPAAREAKILHARAIRFPFATPALAPGTNPLRPGTRTPIRGLFLAGDYTDTGLPATVEGACVSGYHAADAILADR